MSWGTVGTIKMYGREGEQGGEGGRGNEGGETFWQKNKRQELMITWDLEMGTRRTEASSPFSFSFYCFLDLSFPFFTVSPPSCPLSLSVSPSFFQHPITASACCLSCGVHGWKWLGTSNLWEKKEGEGGERDGASERDWFLYLEERMLLLLMSIIRGDGHQKLCFSSVSHKCAYILVYTHTCVRCSALKALQSSVP